MLLEVLRQGIADGRVDDAGDLRVAELRLRLSLKLRLSHLDRDHGCKSLTEVITSDLDLLLLKDAGVIGIFLQGTCQCTTEAGQVSTTLSGMDIIDVGEDILIEVRIVGHSDLHRDIITHSIDIYDIADEGFLIGIQIPHEVDQTMSRVE